MITSLLVTQALIAFILLGETRQANMRLSRLDSLMRVVSNLLGINMNACLIKIRKQLGCKEIQRQAQTSSFGKRRRLTLGTVGLCLSVSIQGLMLINASIRLEVAIDMRSLLKYVCRLTMMEQRINLIGSSQEVVMRKVNQHDTFKENPTMCMTSIISRSNSIPNCKKPRNVPSIEFNQ